MMDQYMTSMFFSFISFISEISGAFSKMLTDMWTDGQTDRHTYRQTRGMINQSRLFIVRGLKYLVSISVLLNDYEGYAFLTIGVIGR